MRLARNHLLRLTAALLALAAAAIPLSVPAADLQPRALLEALRPGGHVLYFRHAETDWSSSDHLTSEAALASCDPQQMRQLSAEGRATARAVGEAMRRLEVPVDAVHASEYCRCVQTARLLNVGPVETTRDILNARAAEYVGGRDALAAAARRRLATPPPAGFNTVLVAHGNVFLLVADIRPPEGGAVVVRPQGEGRFEVLGMLSARDWKALAAE